MTKQHQHHEIPEHPTLPDAIRELRDTLGEGPASLTIFDIDPDDAFSMFMEKSDVEPNVIDSVNTAILFVDLRFPHVTPAQIDEAIADDHPKREHLAEVAKSRLIGSISIDIAAHQQPRKILDHIATPVENSD